jgi:hypothetical protein
LICAANVSFSMDRLWICPSWGNQKGGRREVRGAARCDADTA